MLANKKKIMVERKNTKSPKSMTPREISRKCSRKLKFATVANTNGDAQELKNSSTTLRPLAVKTKHKAAETMKAIT